MHRIDKSGAVTSIPTPAAVGLTVGYFSEGDPSVGQQATIVGADWLNAVQEEVVGVILAAGLTLDKTSQAQLLTAIKALRNISTQRTVTGTDTSVETDETLYLNDASGSFTETLITAIGRTGSRLCARKVNSSSNVITLQGSLSQTIGGALTQTLNDLDDQLILISDGANWLIEKCNFKQFVVGTAQTSDGTLAATGSYGNPSNQPSITFTPRKTGWYKIYGSFPVQNASAGNGVCARIVATAGGTPVGSKIQESCIHNFSGANGADGCVAPYTIAKLGVGVSFTYALQLKSTTGSGALNVMSSLLSGGSFITAEEI